MLVGGIFSLVDELDSAGRAYLVVRIDSPDRNLVVLLVEICRISQIEGVQDIEHVNPIRFSPRNYLSTNPDEKVLRQDIYIVLAQERIVLVIHAAIEIAVPVWNQIGSVLALSPSGHIIGGIVEGPDPQIELQRYIQGVFRIWCVVQIEAQFIALSHDTVGVLGKE